VSELDPAWTSGLRADALEGCPQGAIDAARRAYRSPGRVYHTWNHILACLVEFKALSFERPRPVFLAILFHDAIYIPGRKDNEEKSAQLARMALSGADALPDEEIAVVERMILLTAAHQSHAGKVSTDEAKFLDIDLAILGKPWPAYEEYMNGIRKEYTPAVVPASAYRAGRIAYLRRLARAPSIFITGERESMWGEQARANISREAGMLKAEQGFGERVFAKLFTRFR
jgi:predicted metal-dependent HD superfamily phosphohydrolase